MSHVPLPAVQPLAGSPGAGALHAPWLAARAVGGLSLFAAWVHLAYIESHWGSWWAYGLFFLVTGVGQALFVPLILYRPRTWVAVAGILGNLAIVGMYVLSRTEGIPFGPHARVVEHADAIDLATTAAEIGIVGALLVMLPRGARGWMLNALLLAGALLWALRLAGPLS
jgi:hypothetical protein